MNKMIFVFGILFVSGCAGYAWGGCFIASIYFTCGAFQGKFSYAIPAIFWTLFVLPVCILWLAHSDMPRTRFLWKKMK